MTRFLPETGQPRIPRVNRSESDNVTGQETGFDTLHHRRPLSRREAARL